MLAAHKHEQKLTKVEPLNAGENYRDISMKNTKRYQIGHNERTHIYLHTFISFSMSLFHFVATASLNKIIPDKQNIYLKWTS